MGGDERLQRGAVAVLADLEADVPARSADDTGDRRAIIGERPVAAPLVGAAARRVERVAVGDAFLAGVLVQLIRFDDRVRQRR